MLHNEARNLLVKAYEKTHDAKAVALAYGGSVPTVYRLAEQKAENEWSGFSKTTQASRLVFKDENGVNINMSGRNGRGKGGRRVADHAPLNTPESTTVLSSIRLDGTMAFTAFQGGTTAGKFLNQLKEVLIPTLRPGDIVVMDNLRTHHVQTADGLLRDAGAEGLYLPAYSPDLNPVEKLWSKVKAALRKLRGRSPDAIDAAIQSAFAVSPRMIVLDGFDTLVVVYFENCSRAE